MESFTLLCKVCSGVTFVDFKDEREVMKYIKEIAMVHTGVVKP